MAPIQAVDGGRNMSLETTTLGAGCFWCVEAVYQNLRGIASAVSGYMGGALEHPTYEAVCSGRTGHAEVVQLQFDPEVISFDDVLYIFWRTHDPTTLNRQGADSGTQYRSAIFYHTPEQFETAIASKVAIRTRPTCGPIRLLPRSRPPAPFGRLRITTKTTIGSIPTSPTARWLSIPRCVSSVRSLPTASSRRPKRRDDCH